MLFLFFYYLITQQSAQYQQELKQEQTQHTGYIQAVQRAAQEMRRRDALYNERTGAAEDREEILNTLKNIESAIYFRPVTYYNSGIVVTSNEGGINEN